MGARKIPEHLRLAFWDFCAEVAEGRRHLWTDADRDYMRKHYPYTATRIVAQALGRTEDAIITEACSMGIYKAGRQKCAIS